MVATSTVNFRSLHISSHNRVSLLDVLGKKKKKMSLLLWVATTRAVPLSFRAIKDLAISHITVGRKSGMRLCSPDRFDPYLSFWSICT